MYNYLKNVSQTLRGKTVTCHLKTPLHRKTVPKMSICQNQRLLQMRFCTYLSPIVNNYYDYDHRRLNRNRNRMTIFVTIFTKIPFSFKSEILKKLRFFCFVIVDWIYDYYYDDYNYILWRLRRYALRNSLCHWVGQSRKAAPIQTLHRHLGALYAPMWRATPFCSPPWGPLRWAPGGPVEERWQIFKKKKFSRDFLERKCAHQGQNVPTWAKNVPSVAKTCPLGPKHAHRG